MKFFGKFVNEKGQPVEESFEFPDERSFKRHITGRGWRVLAYGQEGGVKKGKYQPSNWFYPALETQEDVDWVIRNAFAAAVLSCGLTAVLALLPLFGVEFAGFSLLNLVDAALVGGLAAGLKKKSRACAVFLLVYFFLNKIYMLAVFPSRFSGSTFGIIFWGMFYVNGVRGAFAHARLNRA